MFTMVCTPPDLDTPCYVPPATLTHSTLLTHPHTYSFTLLSTRVSLGGLCVPCNHKRTQVVTGVLQGLDCSLQPGVLFAVRKSVAITWFLHICYKTYCGFEEGKYTEDDWISGKTRNQGIDR